MDKIIEKMLKHYLMLLALPLLLLGCSSPTYNVTVEMAPNFHTSNGVYPSIEVDLVAANDNDAIRITSYSTDDYFQPGNKFRNNLEKHTMYFSEESFKPQTFPNNDPLWEKWNDKGVTRLFIISNLPGVWEINQGQLDARKLNLPLSSDSWPNDTFWGCLFSDGDTIKVEMKSSGLFLLTPMKPLGKK